MKKYQSLVLFLIGSAIVMGLYFTVDIIIEKEEKIAKQQVIEEQAKLENTKGENPVIRDTAYYIVKYSAMNDKIPHLFSITQGDSYYEIGHKLNSNLSYPVGANLMVQLEKVSKEKNPQANEEEDAVPVYVNPLDSDDFSIELIRDYTAVDYKKYIPEVRLDDVTKKVLDIKNPSISLKAEAAILMDIKTGEVLYYKNVDETIFPASTAKLLTSLVALEFCDLEEEVTIGDEIGLIASDSSKAHLKRGYKMTIYQLLEAMLIPSGNDAAYATATYVGRKVLGDETAEPMVAVKEFVRRMNRKAKQLGLKNSCFMTPDGYDAIGQYTTAYDMALIGLEAYRNETIVKISKMSSARATLISGEDVTWNTTNGLIKKDSPNYYSNAVGLKTGTSTMAGRCIITVGKRNRKEILAVVMNSSALERFKDAKKLLEYGLSK